MFIFFEKIIVKIKIFIKINRKYYNIYNEMKKKKENNCSLI